jgi:hypothetical protein
MASPRRSRAVGVTPPTVRPAGTRTTVPETAAGRPTHRSPPPPPETSRIRSEQTPCSDSSSKRRYTTSKTSRERRCRVALDGHQPRRVPVRTERNWSGFPSSDCTFSARSTEFGSVDGSCASWRRQAADQPSG